MHHPLTSKFLAKPSATGMIPSIPIEFIMRPPILSLPALLLSTLLGLGCGVKPTGTTTTQSPYTFSGDWGISAVLGITTQPPIDGFLGTLSASDGVVTGGLVPLPNSAVVGGACTTPSLTPVPVAGAVDSNGNLTITLPVAGGTATLTATISTNVETEATGSYKIVGGTCATTSTAMQIAQYAPLNGTYTGTLTATILPRGVQSNSTTTVSAVLAQSSTPNSNGLYPVAGTVTLGGACVATFTLSNAFVLGGALEGPDTSGNYFFGGASDPTASTLDSFLTIQNSSTGCPFDNQYYLSGNLTRQ
jgi:hypothetical protein